VLDGRTYFIKGIISSTLIIDNRCDVNKYAVYTNIHEHLEWIVDIVEETTELPTSQELIDMKCIFVDNPKVIISKFASGFWKEVDVKRFA